MQRSHTPSLPIFCTISDIVHLFVHVFVHFYNFFLHVRIFCNFFVIIEFRFLQLYWIPLPSLRWFSQHIFFLLMSLACPFAPFNPIAIIIGCAASWCSNQIIPLLLTVVSWLHPPGPTGQRRPVCEAGGRGAEPSLHPEGCADQEVSPTLSVVHGWPAWAGPALRHPLAAGLLPPGVQAAGLFGQRHYGLEPAGSSGLPLGQPWWSALVEVYPERWLWLHSVGPGSGSGMETYQRQPLLPNHTQMV